MKGGENLRRVCLLGEEDEDAEIDGGEDGHGPEEPAPASRKDPVSEHGAQYRSGLSVAVSMRQMTIGESSTMGPMA